MRSHLFGSLAMVGAWSMTAVGEENPNYTNFIRQIQLPSGLDWQMSVASEGQDQSMVGVDSTGSEFELWTIQNNPMQAFLLDTAYVGAYVPKASISIETGDPYHREGVVRTRADQPFKVTTKVENLVLSPEAPTAAKEVTYLHHKQAYGPGGPGVSDPSQASLHSKEAFTQNKDYVDDRPITVVPGAERIKVWGEERFSVFSLQDGEVPPLELVSQTIRILPVVTGAISGISEGEGVRYAMPKVVFSADDVYPQEGIFVRVHPGAYGATLADPDAAKRLPIAWTNTSWENPQPTELSANTTDWNGVITSDGEWTIELWAENPYFGNLVLDHVTFTYESSIRVQSLVGGLE